MDFSLFYFANDSREHSANRYRLLLDGARFADRNGFTAVWMPERHFHPFGGLYPNPSVTGAAVAAVTQRVKIRAGSVVAPLHHPLRIAEEWSVIDNLSDGRVGISFASGWHAVDFAFNPGAYAGRRTSMDETIRQVRSLWRGETIEVLDGHGNPQRLGIFPPPIQPELPVWVTAGETETFQKAGRLGAGVLTHLLSQDFDDLAAKISAYRAALADRPDSDGWTGHVALMVHTCLGEDEDEMREIVHGPMCRYLRSSFGLLLNSQSDGARTIDPAELDPDDVEFVIGRAFDRYYAEGALLGTVHKVRGLVDRWRDIGVDEVACLIDFGVPEPVAMAGLDHLNVLREMSHPAIVAGGER